MAGSTPGLTGEAKIGEIENRRKNRRYFFMELEKLKESLMKIPQAIQEKIKLPSLTPELKIPQAKGCPDCNFTGYRGRIGIYETFLVDDEMERFILANPSIVDLRDLAIKKGMILMGQDGFIKVLERITTIEEVERVAGE